MYGKVGGSPCRDGCMLFCSVLRGVRWVVGVASSTEETEIGVIDGLDEMGDGSGEMLFFLAPCFSILSDAPPDEFDVCVACAISW